MYKIFYASPPIKAAVFSYSYFRMSGLSLLIDSTYLLKLNEYFT